jgi:predicted DNA-binding transcriptional regulator YafY
MLLQTRGRLTARQLADELEVSPRTIYRDVEALHSAGIPLYGDAGHAGGYQLIDGFRTRLTGLTAKEAESLFLAAMPGPANELGCGMVVAALQLKLQAALPPPMRRRAMELQQRFHLDAPGWYQEGDRSAHLVATAQAVWDQHRVQIRYRDSHGEATAVLEPRGLVLKGGRWYVVANHADDASFTTYRISEITGLTRLAETFAQREDFDLADYWRSHVREFHERQRPDHVVVRVSPHGLARLREIAPAVTSMQDTAEAPDHGGWVTAVVAIESSTHAHDEFLRLGADIEVVSPPDLRARLATTARALAVLYNA